MSDTQLRTETKEALDNIMDVLSGKDGGISFICLMAFLRDIDSRAAAGDMAAEQVIDVMLRFNRLIEVAINTTQFKKE